MSPQPRVPGTGQSAAHVAPALPGVHALFVVLRSSPLEAESGPHVGPQHNDDLVTALRSAAGAIARRRSIRDLEQTLQEIVSSAVDTVPGSTPAASR